MIALLAPLALQAIAPGFAPPLDQPLAYTVSEVREDGARRQRFRIDRRVVFRREADGFAAEIETLAVTGDPGGAGPLFAAMARSMLGRRIVVRLNRAGDAVDVADLDAIWNAQLAAMTRALVSKDPARAVAVETLLAPLRSLPRAARMKRIGEMIAPLIADRSFAAAPSRSITVPARGQDGVATLLAGTERITVQPDRRLLLERHAGGTVGGSTISVSLRRRIDPQSGLVAETTNIETVETAGARLIVTRSIVAAF